MEKRIVVDAMGGDFSPKEIVMGAVQAAQTQEVNLILVGREGAIQSELNKYEYPRDKIKIVHAEEIIGTDEPPTVAIKRKKDSSIVVGLKILKDGRAHAFVSAGSTGAVLAGGTLIAGRIEGIERPALATLLPNKKGYALMLDVGANVDAKPVYLLQFAQMGSVYMEKVMGINNPSVGLINIGTEKEKGNALTKEAYGLLEKAGLNFIGNVEAREIPHGAADVLVCDAFVGNVILKYTEGFADAMLNMIKKELMSNALSKIGATMLRGSFSNLKKSFDYSEIGGAPLLGLNALVVKAHGASNAKAINAAISQCRSFIEKDVIGKIKEKL